MLDLKRYEKIKDAYYKKIENKQEKLYLDDKNLNLINYIIPNFISDDLDNLTNKMSEFYDVVKFPNYDDCEDYASLYDNGIKNLFTKRIDQELSYGTNIL